MRTYHAQPTPGNLVLSKGKQVMLTSCIAARLLSKPAIAAHLEITAPWLRICRWISQNVDSDLYSHLSHGCELLAVLLHFCCAAWQAGIQEVTCGSFKGSPSRLPSGKQLLGRMS